VTHPVRWLADENFNNDIVRALLRRNPSLDLIRAQDVGLSGVSDPELLGWAANEGRIVLTHDVTTLTAYAYSRVSAGRPMPGAIEVSQRLSIASVVEDVLLISECSQQAEWEGRVVYLPLG
jgi:hypothetical protein